MDRLGYGYASVVFLISRVGTSEDARQFIQGIGNDPIIGSTVYVSLGDLAAKKTVFEKSRDDNAYTLLVSVFVASQCIIICEYTLTICSLADQAIPISFTGSNKGKFRLSLIGLNKEHD